MQWDTQNCEKVAEKVVKNWSQSDMVVICENYVFEQLQDSEEHFNFVVKRLEKKEKK